MDAFSAPWHLIEDSQGYQNIHHRANPDEGDTGDIVATCFQDEAHAHLIAAAPELLAASKNALETLVPWKDDDFVWAAMSQLVAAITKATL
jgi:hypothetical protein